MVMRLLRRLGMSALRVFCVLAVFLACCQSKLIYMPGSYTDLVIQNTDARPLHYTTAQGAQVAWLHPKRVTSAPPHVHLVFAGNGTRALDLADYFDHAAALEKDLFVLVDYPGYGRCEGTPSPDHIRESVQALVPALAKELGMDKDLLCARTQVFGHSLGCAAALMAMHEHALKQGVLVSPFGSMMSMARRKVGWPLCLVLHHRFDNVAELARVAEAGGHVRILHGTDDEIIPQEEGRNLAASAPSAAEFRSAEKGLHNEILFTHRRDILEAVRQARQ